MWHTIRFENGSWQQFGDVKGQAGDPGSFSSVSCGSLQGELYVCGVTTDAKLWHTIRFSQPPSLPLGWLPFEDVAVIVGNPNPGLFVFATLVGIATGTLLFLLDLCGGPQADINHACYRIRHSQNVDEKAGLRGYIQDVRRNNLECSLRVPC